MEARMKRLSLNDKYSELSASNVQQFNDHRRQRLEQYAESEESDDFDIDGIDERFKRGVQRRLRTDNFSQSSPSRSASDYVESDTDLTDFADGLELDNDLDLMAKFHAVRQEAERRARQAAWDAADDDEDNNWDVFYYRTSDGQFKKVDDLMMNDPQRFHKSVVVNTTTPRLRSSQSTYKLASPTKQRLKPKQSMPNFQDRSASPSKLRKSSSALFDFKSSTRKYPVMVDDDGVGTLEVPQFRKSVRNRVSFDDDTITIQNQARFMDTRKVDLSKYQETGYQTLKPKSSKKFSNIRLIRQLNTPDTKVSESGMRYNPILQKWEGNEAELSRFDTVRGEIHTITPKEAPERVNGMVFDNKNMRWVHEEGEEDDDPFAGIEDLGEPQRQWSQSTTASIDTQDPFLQSVQSSSNCFRLNHDQLRSFANEEHKWTKKVKHWFPQDTLDDSHLYELRNFVIQSQRK